MCRTSPNSKIIVTWIWKAAAHPRVQGVAWDSLMMHVLLKDRGMGLLTSFSVYKLEDESTKYALLQCSRERLVWRMAGSQPWAVSIDPWLNPFLDEIR